MKLLQENPFLAGVILVVVVGCAVVGFLLSGAMAMHEETTLAYQQAVQRLHTLQNKVPFPDESNVKKSAELRDQFAAKLDELRSQLSELQRPLDSSITSQEFQDNLRSTVDKVAAQARASKVPLPEDFYLGFDRYRDSLPSEAAAPHLARQLEFIAEIVGDLIGSNPESAGIRSIDSLVRIPLPVETPGRAKTDQESPRLEKFPFSLGFTAEQGKFRIALNALLRMDQFMIIRALSITNTNPTGPPVETDAAPTTQASSPLAIFNDQNKNEDNNLNVLLGRERVQVRLSIEMVDFNLPVVEPPDKASPKESNEKDGKK